MKAEVNLIYYISYTIFTLVTPSTEKNIQWRQLVNIYCNWQCNTGLVHLLCLCSQGKRMLSFYEIEPSQFFFKSRYLPVTPAVCLVHLFLPQFHTASAKRHSNDIMTFCTPAKSMHLLQQAPIRGDNLYNFRGHSVHSKTRLSSSRSDRRQKRTHFQDHDAVDTRLADG